MTPTQLTLRKLRADGWTVTVVERWDSFAHVRHDLFGFIDVLALRGGETLAVQATSADNVAARVRKIAESEHVAAVREAGWSIRVWGWRKEGRRWVLHRDVDCS